MASIHASAGADSFPLSDEQKIKKAHHTLESLKKALNEAEFEENAEDTRHKLESLLKPLNKAKTSLEETMTRLHEATEAKKAEEDRKFEEARLKQESLGNDYFKKEARFYDARFKQESLEKTLRKAEAHLYEISILKALHEDEAHLYEDRLRDARIKVENARRKVEDARRKAENARSPFSSYCSHLQLKLGQVMCNNEPIRLSVEDIEGIRGKRISYWLRIIRDDAKDCSCFHESKAEARRMLAEDHRIKVEDRLKAKIRNALDEFDLFKIKVKTKLDELKAACDIRKVAEAVSCDSD